MFQILVAEDDRNLKKLIVTVLRQNGYRTFEAENGSAALKTAQREHIDLVITDVMMPEMDGYELTERLRQDNQTLPILMITARETLADKRRGFLVGTDDYMVKPIEPDELLMRVKALLRRSKIVSERMLTIGRVTLDYDALSVARDGETSTLPPKEFYLLYKLLSYPGVIFTRVQLMDEIWGMDSEANDRTVDVHIKRLRARFEAYPEFEIVTIRGIGYKAVKKE